MTFGLLQRVHHFGCALACATLLLSACAGRAERDSGQHSSAAGFDAGGSFDMGGEKPVNTGGGAALDPSTGGGSAQPSQCANVNCESIPNTCKHIVQSPGDCCATCTDTGCDACPAVDCAPGFHSQTMPGDCCPSCAIDPPDACLQGQSNYADFRVQLLEKYSESGCKNSADCVLVHEDNACALGCSIALPALTAQNFAPNLQGIAQGCGSCEPPGPIECIPQSAACVNGKCVAVDLQ